MIEFVMKPALRKKLFWAVSISLISPVVVCILYYARVFERPEHMLYDAMARHVRASKAAHPDVAVILIDEASLKAMNPLVGRWPWPRSVFADAIDFIGMGNPKAIAFDILFTENERPLLQQSAESPRGPLSPGDARLVEATTANRFVYHALQILRDEEDEFNKGLLNRAMPEGFGERFKLKGVNVGIDGESGANNFYIPFEELYRASRGVGVVEFQPDADGVYRRSRPLRQYKGEAFPVLGLAPVMDGFKRVGFRGDALLLDDAAMPLDGEGRYLVNMYGRYNTYSMSGILASLQKLRSGDVENLIISPYEFEGKVVFIGASAVGVEDVKSTPMSNRTPGVMLHASFLSNILLKDFLRPKGRWVTVVSVFLLSIASVWGMLFFGKLHQKIAVPALLVLLYGAFAVSRFQRNEIYEVVPAAAVIVFGFMASFAYLTFTEGKEKRKVRKMLGQYVSPQVLSEVVDKYEDFLKAEVGSREQITVLFADIRGFTNISEGMPPDRVVEMLNYYFSVWSDVIFKYGGTVDKFIGDAIMALWGAPIKTADHASKAVRAALEMRERLKEVNRTLGEKGFPPVRIGIGINTGEAVLGNIGSERKLDYTVIGDTVNLASRLEALTKEYGCDILISESTATEIDVPTGFVAEVKIRGKEKPVRIFSVTAA